MYPAKELVRCQVWVDEASIETGADLLNNNCSLCHGNVGEGGGIIPDLGYSGAAVHGNFQQKVRKGALLSLGCLVLAQN